MLSSFLSWHNTSNSVIYSQQIASNFFAIDKKNAVNSTVFRKPIKKSASVCGQTDTVMPRNVEIKAKLKDFQRALQITTDLCKSNCTLLSQEDIFFKVPHGRLKLRNFGDCGSSELISYFRPDIEGPKLSDYSICKINNNKDLLQVLKSSLGIIGTVRKTRHLFLYGQTRIHLDIVENLGEFLELEVVLEEDQDISHGKKIAYELLNKLEVIESDLITGAYIDLLAN